MFNSFNIESEHTSDSKPKGLTVGPVMFRPVIINPTRAQLNEFLGSDKKTDEINYHSETTIQGELVDMVRINIWGYFTTPEGTEYRGGIDPIWIKNKEMKSKDGLKNCYINPFGRSCWTSDPKQANQYWYNGSSKKCIWGEDKLMDFVINLMGINTFYSADSDKSKLPSYIQNSETFIDMNKLFQKDYSDIQSLITRMSTDKTDVPVENPNYQRKITTLSYVKQREDTGEAQQAYYSGKFGRVNKRKGNYSIVDSDVKQIANTFNKELESGQVKLLGIIATKLTEYSPDMVEEKQEDLGW